MADKLPQPTAVLIHRLRRLAKHHDRLAHSSKDGAIAASHRARASTCWQSAARLEECAERGDDVDDADQGG